LILCHGIKRMNQAARPRRGGLRRGAGRRRIGKPLRFRASDEMFSEVARFAAYRQLEPSEWLRTCVARGLAWEQARERERNAGPLEPE
jgi:hypothetical protein